MLFLYLFINSRLDFKTVSDSNASFFPSTDWIMLLYFKLLTFFIVADYPLICKSRYFSRNNSNNPDKKLIPSLFSQQPIRVHLHPTKSKPFLSQVLQRGTDMIYCVVDAEEVVVGVLERIDGDGTVLRVVALQVEGELLGNAACVYLCGCPRFELSQILRQLPCRRCSPLAV